MTAAKSILLVVGASFALVACGDDPAQPKVRIATTVQATQGDGQGGIAGEVLPFAPTVVVRDADGVPLPGVVVRFAIIEGGGSIPFAIDTTDLQGSASAGPWRLGVVPGNNRLSATVDALPPVEFTAKSTSPFSIIVRYIGTATPRQQQAVENAVSRWRSVIIGDLSDVPLAIPASSCLETQPAINETVDDLLLFVEFLPIDGVGQVLGQAGPCLIRNTGSLPIVGFLQLDAADLVQMEAAGTIDDVVTHEIGHVLGFGTIWPELSLLSGRGGSNPLFIGFNGLGAYRALGGTADGVPVENMGGRGTRDGHWRESVFGIELMTGFVNGGMNPLSAMTVASFTDLGYSTNLLAASAYVPSAPLQMTAGTLNLTESERLVSPRFKVDRNGKPTKIGA